jgi:sugar lactone lactonase YvrE
MRISKRIFLVVAAVAVLVLVVGFASLALTSGHVTAVASFDPSMGQFPEGVAVDKTGDIFVGLGPPLGPYGEIRKIGPDGSQTSVVQIEGGPGPSGLAIDVQGTLYFGLFTMDEATRGVYRVNGEGAYERLPGTGAIMLPNGLAFDKRGNLYVTDSIPGIVWRIPRDGSAEAWYVDEALVGCGFDPSLPPVGANGIVYWHNDLYVASTEQGLIMRIPVLPDGAVGQAEIIAGEAGCTPGPMDGLDSVDGLAMDVHGNIFAALVIQNKLVRLNTTTGEITELLSDADGLHNPASIAFGTGMGQRETVFITNFALIQPVPGASLGPAVLGYDVGTAGLPLP